MSDIQQPAPQTPVRVRSSLLFPPPSLTGSRAASPHLNPVNSPSPLGFRDINPYAALADKLVDHIGNHMNTSDALFDPIQQALRTGGYENQATLTLCLLLMEENRQTHTMLNTLAAKVDAISSVQAVHSASLNKAALVSATSRPFSTPIEIIQPPARQSYSAVAAGPPPPSKKLKRKAGPHNKPPPIDYLAMSKP